MHGELSISSRLGMQEQYLLCSTCQFTICTHTLCSECNSNGTHTCYVEYTVDENNRLSNDQLESLKEDLILLFNLQHTHRDDDKMIDVQRIYKEHFEGNITHNVAYIYTTVEPPNKGHLRSGYFVLY